MYQITTSRILTEKHNLKEVLAKMVANGREFIDHDLQSGKLGKR